MKYQSCLVVRILLLLCALVVYGCAVFPRGGAVSWETRELRQELDLDSFGVHEAVIRAMGELGLSIEEEERTPETVTIRSRSDDGELILIEIRRLKVYRIEGTKHDLRPGAGEIPRYLTAISIRIGPEGEKGASEKLLRDNRESS